MRKKIGEGMHTQTGIFESEHIPVAVGTGDDQPDQVSFIV